MLCAVMYNNSPFPIGVIGAGMVLYAGHALICDSWRELTWDRASATILAVVEDPRGMSTGTASLAVTTQDGETIHIEAAPGVITDPRTPGPFDVYFDRDHPASLVPVPVWSWRRNKLVLLIMGLLLLGPALSSFGAPLGAVLDRWLERFGNLLDHSLARLGRPPRP